MSPWLEVPALALQAWLALGAFSPLIWLAGIRRPLVASPPAAPGRLAVLVPAHNEAAVIGALLQDLAGQDYPLDLLHVLVIADGCTDATAAIARAAGAQVLELAAATGRKGEALRLGWESLRGLPDSLDAVVVLDADNRVEPSFLAAMNRHLACHPAVQGIRGSRAPASAVGRLDHLSEWLNGRVEARGRAAWGLSVKIAGSGWGLQAELADAWGFQARTMVEDVELTAGLASRGIRVAFAPDVVAYDEKVANGAQFDQQRARWVRGRFEVAWRLGLPLLLAPNLTAWEFGAYLLAPMRSVTAAGTVVCGALALAGLPGVWSWQIWLAAGVAQAAYVAGGLALSGAGKAEWRSLIAAACEAWRPLLAVARLPFAARSWGHTLHVGAAGALRKESP